MRTWQDVQALLGEQQAPQDPGEPTTVAPADVPLTITDAWRAFARQYGVDGEDANVVRGSALQVGGRVGIVVNLETLLGLSGGGGDDVPEGFSETLSVAAAGDHYQTITLPEGRTRWRLLRVWFNRTQGSTVGPTTVRISRVGPDDNTGEEVLGVWRLSSATVAAGGIPVSVPVTRQQPQVANLQGVIPVVANAWSDHARIRVYTNGGQQSGSEFHLFMEAV